MRGDNERIMHEVAGSNTGRSRFSPSPPHCSKFSRSRGFGVAVFEPETCTSAQVIKQRKQEYLEERRLAKEGAAGVDANGNGITGNGTKANGSARANGKANGKANGLTANGKVNGKANGREVPVVTRTASEVLSAKVDAASGVGPDDDNIYGEPGALALPHS